MSHEYRMEQLRAAIAAARKNFKKDVNFFVVGLTYGCLITVIRASRNINLNVIMAREYNGLYLPRQFICIAVSTDTMVISDTCRNIPCTDCRVSALWIPFLRLMRYCVHIYLAKLCIHLFDIVFQISIHGRNILIGNAGYVKRLPRSKVKVPIAPSLRNMLNH